MTGELQGTGVVESVEKDLLSIEADFNNIVLPFVKKHKDLFTE
jgi:SET domain-containing protein 6